MRLNSATLFFTVLMIATSISSFGKEVEGARKKAVANPGITANCSPATAANELNINNVNALIQSGGDMWWDFNTARYEVPSGSGRTSLFAGSLWLGGQDVSGQLKVAALRFRQSGNDYWTGPLSTTTAEIDPETCSEYDRHFPSTRDEVAQFVAWYEAGEFDIENGTTTQRDNFPDYAIPSGILNWPAHGRNFDPYNEDYFLAPYVDRNGDDFYDPAGSGDYPAYDLKGEADCSQKIANVYGDQNLWWVFNDKGNVHTETGAEAIGMEIRAQAFAFATNDEVNNMTFYNYELINRSTFTLAQTYFGQWADGDLGNARDDYVGCDVERGLGYFYNGDALDEDQGGNLGYGQQPPAVGIDFFQGPFQDADLIDNAVGIGDNEALNGVGYGDGFIDNERFGMRRFLYHNNSGPIPAINDPATGTDYYNYLRSIWLDGNRMTFGGNGYNPTDPTAIEADFMFPGDTDPLNWGTRGIDPGDGNWTEETAGNTPLDRRFAQSAGPFTLAPGAVNNITVGVVWARASAGGPFASVEALRKADDKTQALFDSCFELFSGPDAPDVTVQELDRELILYLSNSTISNNYKEGFSRINRFLTPAPDAVDSNSDGVNDLLLTDEEKELFQTYKFQGYQIYQLADNSVSADELNDPDRARLVTQVDIEDDITQLVNYTFDDQLGAAIPEEKVNGANEGIQHSFVITNDLFATGDNRLINHRQYYYMAIAYAYNNYGDGEGFLQYLGAEYLDPTTIQGQKEPYVGSRKAATGPIRIYSGVPHKIEPELGGAELNSAYGDGVEITQVEGRGNGGNGLSIRQEDIDAMFASAPTSGSWKVDNPTYEAGNGPVDIKVIDPLSVRGGDYTLRFLDSTTTGDLSDAYWILYGTSLGDTVSSAQSIDVANEQIILDLGISISIGQTVNPGEEGASNNGLIDAVISFDDERRPWLSGIPDNDGLITMNWIRSGTNNDPDAPDNDDYIGKDDDQVYEGLIGGTWAPLTLTASQTHGPLGSSLHAVVNELSNIESVDIIFTSDKSKWTRCPVIEMQDVENLAVGNIPKSLIRADRSVDKDGNPGSETNQSASSDPESANYISAFGMGWFPGYAVSLETGERLNMAFGEDSWLAAENGQDMVWNPTGQITEGFFGDVRFGGKHYVFVFRNDSPTQANQPDEFDRMPAYDAGAFMKRVLGAATNPDLDEARLVYGSAMWAGLPLLGEDQTLLSNDARVSLRVSKPYERFALGSGAGNLVSTPGSVSVGSRYYVNSGPVLVGSDTLNEGDVFVASAGTITSLSTEADGGLVSSVINAALPQYNFNLDALAPTINDNDIADDALDLINIVPNPYYAYSQYEETRLDNLVKITNLPQTCTVTIYTVNGTLIRTFSKDDPTTTSVDWDLTNFANVPIASGMYIVHIDVPGVGEKVLKWFGVIRPVDLDSF